jgi:hypothetical protein
MSPAYPHLLLNHLPIGAALTATVLLAVAARRRTLEGAIYGYVAQVVTGVLAIAAFVSGNFAPPALAGIAGVATEKITFHQVSGLATMIVAVLLGLLACIPLYLPAIANRRGVLIAYLVLALGLDALLAVTASSGGAIRHTELGRYEPVVVPVCEIERPCGPLRVALRVHVPPAQEVEPAELA